jgi:hypothetical protein
MKGFKKTGNGPRYGKFAFSPKAGFSSSTGKRQEVRSYSRSVPAKHKFAAGGMVTAPMASGDSAVIKRTKPVTGFDAEAGGKSPLRPGFNKGGKACYAEGGKVATTGAAIKMMKQLMKQGNSHEQAAQKAAQRYGVAKSAVAMPSGPTGGGGMPAEKQMLARGGLPASVRNMVNTAASQVTAAPPPGKMPPQTMPSGGPPTVRTPISGYGSFRRGPVFGGR